MQTQDFHKHHMAIKRTPTSLLAGPHSQGGFINANYTDNPKSKTITYPVTYEKYESVSFAILETSTPSDRWASVFSQQRQFVSIGYILPSGNNYRINWISFGH